MLVPLLRLLWVVVTMLSDDEYTPTTEEVRNSAAFGAVLAALIPDEAMDIDFPEPGFRVAAKSSFDLWLAAHDREVAAKAWGEGYEAGQGDEAHWSRGLPSDPGADEHPHDNPYAALMSEPSTSGGETP